MLASKRPPRVVGTSDIDDSEIYQEAAASLGRVAFKAARHGVDKVLRERQHLPSLFDFQAGEGPREPLPGIEQVISSTRHRRHPSGSPEDDGMREGSGAGGSSSGSLMGRPRGHSDAAATRGAWFIGEGVDVSSSSSGGDGSDSADSPSSDESDSSRGFDAVLRPPLPRPRPRSSRLQAAGMSERAQRFRRAAVSAPASPRRLSPSRRPTRGASSRRRVAAASAGRRGRNASPSPPRRRRGQRAEGQDSDVPGSEDSASVPGGEEEVDFLEQPRFRPRAARGVKSRGRSRARARDAFAQRHHGSWSRGHDADVSIAQFHRELEQLRATFRKRLALGAPNAASTTSDSQYEVVVHPERVPVRVATKIKLVNARLATCACQATDAGGTAAAALTSAFNYLFSRDYHGSRDPITAHGALQAIADSNPGGKSVESLTATFNDMVGNQAFLRAFAILSEKHGCRGRGTVVWKPRGLARTQSPAAVNGAASRVTTGLMSTTEVYVLNTQYGYCVITGHGEVQTFRTPAAAAAVTVATHGDAAAAAAASAAAKPLASYPSLLLGPSNDYDSARHVVPIWPASTITKTPAGVDDVRWTEPTHAVLVLRKLGSACTSHGGGSGGEAALHAPPRSTTSAVKGTVSDPTTRAMSARQTPRATRSEHISPSTSATGDVLRRSISEGSAVVPSVAAGDNSASNGLPSRVSRMTAHLAAARAARAARGAPARGNSAASSGAVPLARVTRLRGQRGPPP